MADRYTYNNGSQGDNDPFGAGSMNGLANDAFKKSAVALSKAEMGQTTKLFGLFNVDSGVAAAVTSAYGVLTAYASKHLTHRTFAVAEKLGAKAGLQGATLTKAATLATVGMTVGLKTGGFVNQIISSMHDQRKERIKLAHSIGPVLDDIKGKHSLAAYNSVKEADNEVIYAHRQRMAKIDHITNFNNVIRIFGSSGPNLAFDVGPVKSLWRGEIKAEEYKQLQKAQAKNQSPDMMNLTQMLANTLSGPLIERIISSNEYKLQTTLQPYSALEMIRELEDQVATKPDARSFDLPKAYQKKNQRRDSCPLEEYVMRIFIQHQRDMASFSDDHTEIRDALKEDLVAIAKPIAAAIRKGDLSVMSLMRLAGEGKVIKNRGRAIASVEEVQSLIEQDMPKQTTYIHIDPKEYFKNATFTLDDLKGMLKSLEGEEKYIFAAWIPDEVLEAAGMHAADIKQTHEIRAKSYDQMLADAIVGLQAQSDEELKTAGHAQSEITQLRKAYAHIEKEGLAALHDLKSGPANDHGVERLVVNMAAPRIKEDKTYLGTLLSRGRDQFKETAGERSQEEKEHTHRSPYPAKHGSAKEPISHSERQSRRSSAHQMSAERE